MNKRLLLAMGGVVLVSLLALSSFAMAAPAATNTPAPQQAVTATPVPPVGDNGDVNSEGNAPDLTVGAAAAPVNPGVMSSKIIVFNMDSAKATVSITIVNPDGSTKYTFPTFTVAVNGAVSKALPFNGPFSGSAVVSSDKNIQAFVTDSNVGNTARDEYDGTLSPNANLVLPFVRHLAPNTQNSIIAVQNTSPNSSANITLNLFDPSGNPVGSPTTMNNVAPHASAYFNTNALFPSGTFIGSAEISAGGIPLAGAEQTRYLKDTASFRALTSADEGTTLYVGFVDRRRSAIGPVSWSEIYVRNDGGSPTVITARFYSYTGALISTATKTRPPVQPNGLAQFLTNAAEFGSLTSSSAYFKGWAMITSSSQPVSLYSLEAQNSGTKLFGTSGIASTGIKFACGDALRVAAPSQNSTINIVNPNAASANVTVRVYKPSNGASAGSKMVTLGAYKMGSVSLSDAAFAGAGSSFEGLAVINSTAPNLTPIFASVYTPYGSGGITSYTCTRLQ